MDVRLTADGPVGALLSHASKKFKHCQGVNKQPPNTQFTVGGLVHKRYYNRNELLLKSRQGGRESNKHRRFRKKMQNNKILIMNNLNRKYWTKKNAVFFFRHSSLTVMPQDWWIKRWQENRSFCFSSMAARGNCYVMSNGRLSKIEQVMINHTCQVCKRLSPNVCRCVILDLAMQP